MQTRTRILQVIGSPAGVGQPGGIIQQTTTPSSNVAQPVWEQFPVAANTHVVWAITVANLKYLAIYSDQGCTIYTNAPSTGSPQDTIVVAAGQLIEWEPTVGGAFAYTCPFSGNITALYITVTGVPSNVMVDVLVSQ